MIVVAGFNKSGKDVSADYIEREYGYKKRSASDHLRDCIGHDKPAAELRAYGDQLRQQYGAHIVVHRAFNDILQQGHHRGVVSSIRHPAEVEYVIKNGGIPIWIVASLDFRTANYTRQLAGKTEEEIATAIAAFKQEEEIQSQGTGHHLNLEAVKRMIPESNRVTRTNRIEDLYTSIDAVLSKCGLSKIISPS